MGVALWECVDRALVDVSVNQGLVVNEIEIFVKESVRAALRRKSVQSAMRAAISTKIATIVDDIVLVDIDRMVEHSIADNMGEINTVIDEKVIESFSSSITEEVKACLSTQARSFIIKKKLETLLKALGAGNVDRLVKREVARRDRAERCM